VVESSLDGEACAEIDRKTDNTDFDSSLFDPPPVASFPVWNSAECRFIRLTQASKRHGGDDNLHIYAFEFFGTLIE
jgi:hypothetical protein